ncbi:phage tail protein [Escherichia coli]|nr:phage tail protein [Escherichia coli]MED8727214.1 phage tail protein [Escherichia marmotae]MCN6440521.1 phage tail protein [Escherichia coli]MCV1163455.1 phage tail protein [Escherichia coli]MED0492199.1 phage tail protein [Escherichia coli]
MSTKFKTVITTAGAAKLAAATVPGGKKVTLSAMAVGDGNGKLPVPDTGQTKLVHEVWRHALNKVSVDNKNKNYIVAELVVPPEVGGFWMRELGLYDDAGTLIAVSNMAESYKPELAEGSGRAQTCRMVIIVSNVASVELSIDASTVMATQDYVDDKIAEHEQSRRHPDATLTEKGFTQLSSATNSTSEKLAATPKAVKAVFDLANRKQPLDATLTALAGLATGANKLPYFTGTDTVSQTDLTSVGRDILAKTSVLAVIQYLGFRELGTSGEKIPLLSTANTWSARQTFNGGITGALTGNADTATKLKTARKINNVSFDGSTDITLTASDVEALSLEDARKIIQPLPDVWIPFNDSLDMITGFSPSYKKIVIGDDEITMPGDKVVKFKRASKATYINKSGVLTETAIDEPRFERDGLLIEGQRTNYMLNSENPASWGRSSNMDVPETGTDSFGFTYGKFVCNDSLIGQTSAINMASIAATKSVDVSGDNKYVTTSCRFKTERQVRLRIRFDKYDGSATTFLGDAYIDTQTLEINMTGGAASRITARVRKDEATGWIFAEATIQAIDDELKIGSQIQYSPKQGGATVSGDYIYLATPQVEDGSCASSFIISGTTAATRASDIVTVPIKNNLYNLPFTVLCEVHKNWYKTPNAAPRVFDTGGHQTGAAIILGFGSSADYDGFPYCDIGGANRRVNENASLEKMVMGMRVKSDQSTCSVSNGRISSETKTTWSYIQNSATIRIGGQTTAGLRHLFGHIRNFRIWHKALTDQQMAEVI